MNLDSILPDPDEEKIEDLALTYVEVGLGRVFFPENWDNVKNKVEHVKQWLASIGDDESLAEKVSQKVSELRKSDMRWRYP